MTIATAAKFGMHRGLLVAKKFSPQILTGVGVVGVVAAGVLAAKSTLKLEETQTRVEERINVVKSNRDFVDPTGAPLYGTKNDYLKDLTTAYTHAVIDYTKLYGPSITLGLASIACIISAQGIMSKRNVGLAAAYKAVETSFAEYKKKVVEVLGVEAEEELRRNIVKDRETVVDPATGEQFEQRFSSAEASSPYSFIFDGTNPNFSRALGYNYVFLTGLQNQWTDRLRSRGHVFLNEVLDSLGFDHTKEGAVTGWILGENNDNCVDFGFIEGRPVNLMREDAGEQVILLDFNCDGTIYDKI